MSERRDVTIHGETAAAFWTTRQRATLFDPERPDEDPNDLANRLGGVVDPNQVNHNCGMCHKTMRWPLFVAHMKDCMRRNFHTMDPLHRRYAGATIEHGVEGRGHGGSS